MLAHRRLRRHLMPKGPFLPSRIYADQVLDSGRQSRVRQPFPALHRVRMGAGAISPRTSITACRCASGILRTCDRPNLLRDLVHVAIRTGCASLRRRSNGRAGAIRSTHSPMSSAPFSRKCASGRSAPLPTACSRSGASERDGDAQASRKQISCSRQSKGRCRRDNR